MKSFENIISQQIDSNKGINLFYKENPLQLSRICLGMISELEYKDSVIDNAIDKVLKEFYRVNQYYHFNEEDKEQLKSLYRNLQQSIKQNNLSYEELAENHYRNLRNWLQRTNPFAEKIYSCEQRMACTVPCFQYTPNLQLKILNIDLKQLIEPVLDIGCGENGKLVRYLRGRGINAYGIDRYNSDYDYIENSDWLTYNYGINKWGTIVSNLGFSNHFLHHHLRAESDYINYARKYMQILDSLKLGGQFHYAPSLPFIEQYLDNNKYKIINEKNTTITQRINRI